MDPASPAQRAGLAPGDTLMAYNGRDVRTDEISMTRLLVPKSTVKVRVRRDGKVKDLPVVVADAPARIKERRLERDARRGERWRRCHRAAACPGAMTPAAPVVRAIASGDPPHSPHRAASPPVFSFNGVAGAQVVTLSEPMKRSLGLPPACW